MAVASGSARRAFENDGPPRQPLLDEAAASIELAIKDVTDLRIRVGEFAHNTLGPRPETGDGRDALTSPPPSSRADAVRDRLQGLHDAIGRLRSEISRIEAI